MRNSNREDSKLQATLIEALTDPRRFPHPAESVEHLETHISHILLAGDFAYKIKKPLDLGFLDFSSLERRKYYCEEELRLNRRLSPDLYLDCIPISGSLENPLLAGSPEAAIEYAVKMVRFPQEALLNRRLEQGALQPRHMDLTARQLAEFHGTVARTDGNAPFGSPDQIRRPAMDNFEDSRNLLTAPENREKLAILEHWTRKYHARLHKILAERKAAGFIRECHGDLHLENMILQDDQIRVFDCIEFSEELRWIDVMSDLAFLLMDLHRHGAGAMAWRLLNGYLELSGDYAGLAVLPYYLAYRAMVRTKIAAIRLAQPEQDASSESAIRRECRSYLDLALAFIRRPPPFLLITHGVSGSGKSYFTARLLEALGVIRIRSDVERKRLFGLGPLERSGSGLDEGLYTDEATRRTYGRLQQLAGQILGTGYPVLVDAAFLEAEQRRAFRALAERKAIPFVLLSCTADPDTLQKRVARRSAEGDEATEADLKVLEKQLRNYIPPDPAENPLEAEHDDVAALAGAILARIQTISDRRGQ